MAAVLLDTQALLLWTTEADGLSARAERLLKDRRTRAVVLGRDPTVEEQMARMERLKADRS